MGMLQNWPDLRSPISKFWEKSFIDTVTFIKRWKLQGISSIGVALTIMQTIYEVRSLDVIYWHALAVFGLEIFTRYVERMYDKVWQKRRDCVLPFSGNLETTEGVLTTAQQGEG